MLHMECLQMSERLFAAICDGAPQSLVEKCKFSVTHALYVVICMYTSQTCIAASLLPMPKQFVEKLKLHFTEQRFIRQLP